MTLAATMRLAGVCALLATAVGSEASVTYVYEGNFYDLLIDMTPPDGVTFGPENRLTATFELATALPANFALDSITLLSGSISDGTYTFDASSPRFGVALATDAFGNIIEWGFHAGTLEVYAVGEQWIRLESLYYPSATFYIPVVDYSALFEVIGCGASFCEVTESTDSGGIHDDPGTWTLIPEPGTASLLAAGVAAIAWSRRHRSPSRVRRPRGILVRSESTASGRDATTESSSYEPALKTVPSGRCDFRSSFSRSTRDLATKPTVEIGPTASPEISQAVTAGA